MRLAFLLLLLVSSFFLQAQDFCQEGKASYYAHKFDGRPTASGELFTNSKLTAAHRTLPFGTRVVVTNLMNNKQVIVIINDRGPFINGRIIDVSQLAAKELGFLHQGITKVSIEMAHQPIDEDELLQMIKSLSASINTRVDIEYLSKIIDR